MVSVLKGTSPLSESAADRVFHALAHPTRRDILRRSLAGRESVSALARHYPVSLPAVRKHIAVLEEAGLIGRRPVGREQQVFVDLALLRPVTAMLVEFEQLWRQRLAAMDDILAEEASDA